MSLPLFALILGTAACDDAKKDAGADAKKDAKADAGKDAKGDAKGDAKAAEDAKAADAEPAGEGDLIKATSVDWFKEYMAVKGADAMKYMNKKVELTGKVKKVITEMDESQKIWLEGEGEGWVSLQFTDNGAKVKEKGLAEGAEVKATCGIGGADPGKYVMMIDCELQ